MEWTVDRIENGFVIIECDTKTFDIPADLLSSGLKEGDVIDLVINAGKTEKKRLSAEERLKNLFDKKYFE